MPDLPDGWLNEADIRELQRLAHGLAVLELGAWKGRSTVVLAEVARYVVSVDRHQGIGHRPEALAEYLENVRSLGNVAIVVAGFEAFVPLLNSSFDMVFIDGDHDYASVDRDIRLALLIDPLIVALHDYDEDDVREAAADYFGSPPDNLGGSVASYIRRRA